MQHLSFMRYNFPYENSRIHRLMMAVSSKAFSKGLNAILRNPSANVDLNRLLLNYIGSLDKHLDKILKRIQIPIPLAGSITDLGMDIYEILKAEEDKLEERIWPLQKFVDQRWKSRKLLKDLRLTKSSINTIESLSMGLTQARARLVQYRTNVQEFQVIADTLIRKMLTLCRLVSRRRLRRRLLI